jgi:hypothetical protein
MSKELFMLAAFLEEADRNIYHFQEASEENVWSKLLKKTDDAIPNIDISVKHLSEMADIARGLSGQALEASEFFRKNREYFANKKPSITIKLYYPTSFDRIGAGGLSSFVKNVERLFEKISKGDGNIKDVEKYINDPATLSRGKRSVVSISGGGEYYSTKDIMNFDRSYEIEVCDRTIDRTICPMLTEFARQKTDPFVGKVDDNSNFKSDTFAHMVKATKKNITSNFEELLRVEDSAMHSDLPNDIVTRVMYAAKSYYAEICKYLVASEMKYMTEWISDVRNLIQFSESTSQTMTSARFEEGVKAEFESAGLTLDNCSMLDVDVLVTAAQKLEADIAIESSENSDDVEDFDTKVDARSYDLILKMLETYRDVLLEATKFYQDNFHKVSVELLLRRYNLFSDDFWKTINGERSVNDKFLRSVNFHPTLVRLDLQSMQRFAPKISQLYKEDMRILDKFISLVKAGNSNDYSVGTDSFDMENLEEKKAELISKLEDLYSSFELASRDLMKAYIKRLSTIDESVHQNIGSISSFIPDSHDYFIDAFNANYDMVTEAHEEKLTSMFAFYESEYMRSLSDVDIFMEAPNDQNNGNNNNQPQNNNQNNNQKNNNNQNAGNNNQQKANTNPSVEDNSGNNNQNGNNQNTDEGQKTTGFVARIQKFISGVIDKILGFFNKGHMKDKNLKFINDYRNYLTTRNYSNVTIHILPYNNTNYIKWCNNVIKKAASMNEQQLRSMNEDQVYSFLYSGTSFAKVKGDTNAERFELAIKLGTAKNQTIAISNNKIKAQIPMMIEYVLNYYNQIENDLKSLNNEVKSLANLEAIKGTEGNTQTNLSLVPRIINESIGSAINVSRKRANDYMVILNSLVPDNVRKNNQNQQNNNQNNNNNQNVGNGNNQQ